MVYAPETGRSRGLFARPMKLGLLPDATGVEPDPHQRRDTRKLILVIGLGTLSWVATYIGMLELIQANTGDLPLTHKLVIGFSVAMLMTMIIWLLDQIFSPIGAMTRLAYVAGYLFLTLISVGFGFGFFWKVLESRAESSRSAETAVTAVQGALNAASTRLEQLNATLTGLAAISREKAEIERTKGTSCPNSRPGDGPRRKMRDDDAARFGFAADLVAGRVATVKTEMAALDADFAKIASRDAAIVDPKTGTRNAFMNALARKLDITVAGFNALRTDPQLVDLRQQLADRADQSTFGDPKNGGFVCPDAQLSQALRGAVRALGELPVLTAPEIAAVEGAEATIEAFRRLTTTFYGLFSLKMPPSADELRELQKKAIQSVEQGAPPPPVEGGGLAQRDYIPLAVAIFVDLCLLLVAMGRPGHRLHGLVPKMREAEQGPVIEILSRFNDIHRDAQIRENFELFRHVVFDVAGAYYVAVPLDAPPNESPSTREALRIEAQLLANLFTSFEKDRIFSRSWTPFTGTVQKKLARQGSKFAGSEAFRIYKFRDGAWPEIILGAVMGAARRAEAEDRRRRIERDLLRPVAPQPAPEFEARLEPEFEPERASERNTATELEDADSRTTPRRTASASLRASTTRSAPETSPPLRTPRRERQHEHVASAPSRRSSDEFGPYAMSAEAELAESAEATAHHIEFGPEPVPDLVAPANSNTAPALRAEPERQGAAALPGEQRVDVVLKRETATVSLPLDTAQKSDALIGRIGQALSDMPSSNLSPETQVIDVTDFDDKDVSHDDDAAAIAGRLRPAIGRS